MDIIETPEPTDSELESAEELESDSNSDTDSETEEESGKAFEEFDELTQQLLRQLQELGVKFAAAEAIATFKSGGLDAILSTARKAHSRWNEVEALISAIDAEILPTLSIPTDEEIAAAEVSAKAVKDSALHGIQFLTSIHGDDLSFHAFVPEAFRKVSTVKRSTNATSGEVRRPRLSSAKVLLLNGKGEVVKVIQEWPANSNPTFGKVAEAINSHCAANGGGTVTVPTLQNGAFGIAGTKDLSTRKGTAFEFPVSVENGKSKSQFAVTVTPR